MMRKITLIVTALLLTFNFSPLISQAQTFDEKQKLLTIDGTGGEYFGYSVGVSGNYAIIGAYLDDVYGYASGSAYIFYNDSGSWQQHAKLTPLDGASNKMFGYSVDICGNYAIVGAMGDSENGDGSGASYIFYNNSGTWQELSKLTATDPAINDNFGNAVSISETHAIVGSHADDDNGQNSGSAYIYFNNSGTWQLQMKIIASDGVAQDYFGRSVGIHGDFAIVGAEFDDDNGDESGSAYVFYNNSGIWQQTTKLIAFDGNPEDYFGTSVGISDSNIIIGAVHDDDNGTESGSAYIFSNSSGTWQYQTKLISSDGESLDLFGRSVSISGNHAVVGAFRDDDNGDASGSAYIFSDISGSWQQLVKLVASDGNSEDLFGFSAALSEDYIIIGAYRNDENGMDAGSAYIYPGQSQISSLSLFVFLEGPYNGIDMNTNLNPEPIPLSQPYNDPLKWNYQGTESVTAIPNADVVDWVLVELRETSGDASTALPDSMIAQQAAFILKDASIVGLDGTNPLYFDNEITDNLYVVVYHRNHLPIMSSGPLTATKGDYSWDFTTAMSQAYGTDAQVDLGGGVFGMIGGDGNSNGQIEYYDKDSVWTVEAGNADYLSGDFTLNQQTDNIDKNDIWKPNLGVINQVPGNQCEPQPDVADAGSNIEYGCYFGEIMSANTPTNGSGIWSIINGNQGLFYDIHDPETNFAGLPGETYTLKWTILTQCASTYDLVSIHFEPEPTQADAGPDQYNVSGTSTVLEANTPDWGFGEWTIVSGDGGSFEDEFDPTTTFNGIADNTYELKWWIFTACDFTEDNVTINFAPASWSCGDQLVDARDGQSYNSVQIGSQCWLAENLNIGTMIIGTEDMTDNDTIEKYCYDNDTINCNTYGGLYQWNEMMQYPTTIGVQGICPTGWHVPTDEEWKQLEGAVDSQFGYPDPEWENYNTSRGYDAGLNLKSTFGWQSNNGLDLFGFTALPAGRRWYNNGDFSSKNSSCYFWSSSTYYGVPVIWSRRLDYPSDGINRRYEEPEYGFSVRCLNDNTFNQPPTQPSNPSPHNGSLNNSIDTTVLSWSCIDPDGDDLLYNIYFGMEINPQIIQLNHVDTFHNPGTLVSDTTYYWKIVAHDSHGDSTIGDVWSFSTFSNQPPNPPSNPFPQNGATNIAIDTTLSWYCTDANNDDLSFNIYFGTEADPPITLVNHADTFYNPGVLYNGLTYYWKIVAYDALGDSTVGDVWSFTTIESSSWFCGDLLIDDRDEQFYNTVQIGTQCWMAENLNIGTLISGSTTQTDNSIIEKYCYYDDENNCAAYGGLYQWNEMMNYISIEGMQGICPPGWSLPIDEEWKQLEGEVDNQYGYPDPEWDNTGYRGSNAGLNLRSESGWSLSGNGTDLYSFTALPGGLKNSYSFVFLEYMAFFWSSSESSANDAWYRGLEYNNSQVDRSTAGKGLAISVRCLKEDYTVPPFNLFPQDGSTNIPIDIILYWSCYEPDDLTFNIYFGTEPNPPLIQTNHTSTYYNPGFLLYDTTYYWKIVAYDVLGDSTSSKVWNFNTVINENTWQEVYNPETGKTWMDRNLGASQVATSFDDPASYGDLYQWGRLADGHESRLCSTTTTLSNTDIPGHDNFILAPNAPNDWRSPQNNNLWQGVGGINNPCPIDFRIPTEAELNEERLSWISNDRYGAFNSPLKFPAGGVRWYLNGLLLNVGGHGAYWRSSVNGTSGGSFNFSGSSAGMNSNGRAYGFSVRCIKDE